MQIDWQNIKIMLVDDQPEVARDVIDILKKEGFNEDNLTIIQDDFEKRIIENIVEVDLILMDLQLTKGENDGGITLTKQIKDKGYSIPIIVLTHLEADDALNNSLKAGADMFITKIDMESELIPKIEHQLQQYFLRTYSSKVRPYKNLKYFNSKFFIPDDECYALFLLTIKNKNEYLKYVTLDRYYESILKAMADRTAENIGITGFTSYKNHTLFVYGEDKILAYVSFEECPNQTKEIERIKKSLSEPLKVKCTLDLNIAEQNEIIIELDIQCNLCEGIDKDKCFRGIFSDKNENRPCLKNNDFTEEKGRLETYAKALYSSSQTTEIIPYFQPIRDKNNEIIKYEVLARIRKYNGKVESIYPYLDAVKVTGTSYELTSQIIQKACEIFYRSDAFKDKKVGLSFNITNNELLEYEKFSKDLESWIPWIAKAKDKKAAKSRITFEILERDALSEDILDKIHALDKEGYHIAIDDFGVECSSFDKVSDIARDLIIKIDGKYIKDLRTNKRHQKIVRAIAYAAQELNYLTVAEYVEDETTLQMLIDYGIDLFQGFYNNGEPNPHMQEKKRERFYKTPPKRRRRR